MFDLILLLSVVAVGSPGEALADVRNESGPRSFASDAPLDRSDGDRVVLRGAIRTARPHVGDLIVEVRGEVTEGTPTLSIDLGNGIAASVTIGDPVRAALRGPGGESERTFGSEGAFSLRLLARGRFTELSIDGVAGPFLEGLQPLPGGVIRVGVDGGAATFDRLRVVRAPWREEVEVVGADAARIAALEGRPVADFTLLDPPPARLDPEYRLSVDGESTPITIRIAGVRRPASEIPLVEQALALAGVRPWMSPRVLQGAPGEEEIVTGETPYGPYTATHERVVVICDALIGVGPEWPSLTLWDTEKERIIDRTVPGGPMGRGIERDLPDGVSQMKLVLARPGRDSIEHEIVVHRP